MVCPEVSRLRVANWEGISSAWIPGNLKLLEQEGFFLPEHFATRVFVSGHRFGGAANATEGGRL